MKSFLEGNDIKIQRVQLVRGIGSYFREDIDYLQSHPTPVQERYTTPSPKQPFVRMPSEIVSIGLHLANGHIVWGDAVGVAFDGKSGRATAAGATNLIEQYSDTLQTLFSHKSISSYRGFWKEHDGQLRKLPLSLQYGVSQALLAANAHLKAKTMTAVITDEWQLPLPVKAPPLHGSCGADRYHTALRMMAHRLPSLPAGQGDNLPEVLGTRGEKLVEYLTWWKAQVQNFSTEYHPVFHFDLHGLIGKIFDNDVNKITAYLALLEKTASPFKVRIESPVVARSRAEQIEIYSKVKVGLQKSGCSVKLVVDEWANTLEDIRAFLSSESTDWIHIKMPDLGPWHDSLDAVMECKKQGVGALLGGSCIETQISARVSYHLALASQPDLVLLKPGVGFDEALSLAHNEMARVLAK